MGAPARPVSASISRRTGPSARARTGKRRRETRGQTCQREHLLRPSALANVEIERARGECRVGRRFARKPEGDPVRHHQDATRVSERVRPVLLHPDELRQRKDRLGRVPADLEDAIASDGLFDRQRPRRAFGGRARRSTAQATARSRREGRSFLRRLRPRCRRPAGRRGLIRLPSTLSARSRKSRRGRIRRLSPGP